MPNKGSKNKVKKVETLPVVSNPVKSLYNVVLKLNGQDFKSGGLTLLDAFRGVRPESFKTRGLLQIEKDGKKAERYLFIPQMRKLFSGDENSLTKQIAVQSTIKYLTNLL